MFKFFKSATLAIVFLAALISSDIAKAQAPGSEAMLFVSPHRLTINSGSKSASVLVANKSKEVKRYDLALVDQAMNENGLTQRQKNFEYSAKRMLRFVPKRFTLEPGQRQTIRIMVRRPKDLLDGDYHSHLLFRDIPITKKDKAELVEKRKAPEGNKTTFEIKTRYGLAIPVVIQHGEINSDISFNEASVSTMSNPQTAGLTPHLNISFDRGGNAEAAALFKVGYKNGEQMVQNLIPDQWIRIYREVNTVYKSYPLTKLPEGVDITKGSLVLSLTKKTKDGKEETTTKEISLQ